MSKHVVVTGVPLPDDLNGWRTAGLGNPRDLSDAEGAR